MILVVDCGSSKCPEITKMVIDFGFEVKEVKQEDLLNEDLDSFKAIVISGAPILLTEVNKTPYLARFRFLKDYVKPVLGICFGHQILGMINGAEIMRCKEDRAIQQISMVAQSELFNGFANTFEMEEDHCECITIPENFEHLAHSQICENEAMKHKDKLHYGVQFHPEVSLENGKQFFFNFLSLV